MQPFYELLATATNVLQCAGRKYFSVLLAVPLNVDEQRRKRALNNFAFPWPCSVSNESNFLSKLQSLRNETEPSRMQTVSAVQMLRPGRNGNERARTEVDFGAINLPAGRTIYDYVAIILLFIMFVHFAIPGNRPYH